MCKVCDLEAETAKLQDELNFRLCCFRGELSFSKTRAAEIRVIVTKLFTDMLDKLEVIESTKQQLEMMEEVSEDGGLKH